MLGLVFCGAIAFHYPGVFKAGMKLFERELMEEPLDGIQVQKLEKSGLFL